MVFLREEYKGVVTSLTFGWRNGVITRSVTLGICLYIACEFTSFDISCMGGGSRVGKLVFSFEIDNVISSGSQSNLSLFLFLVLCELHSLVTHLIKPSTWSNVHLSPAPGTIDVVVTA